MVKSKDVVTGLVTMALAIFLFIISGNVKDFAAVGVGAGFLPRLAAVLLGVLGVILTFEGWRRGAPPKSMPRAKDEPADEVEVFGGWGAVLISVVLMCAYVGFLESLGFILASTIYAFCQMLILAKNVKWNYLLFGAIALISSAVAYLLFVRVFQVMLPAGILG